MANVGPRKDGVFQCCKCVRSTKLDKTLWCYDTNSLKVLAIEVSARADEGK